MNYPLVARDNLAPFLQMSVHQGLKCMDIFLMLFNFPMGLLGLILIGKLRISLKFPVSFLSNVLELAESVQKP